MCVSKRMLPTANCDAYIIIYMKPNFTIYSVERVIVTYMSLLRCRGWGEVEKLVSECFPAVFIPHSQTNRPKSISSSDSFLSQGRSFGSNTHTHAHTHVEYKRKAETALSMCVCVFVRFP